MSTKIGPCSRGDEEVWASKNGAINPLRRDAAGVKRREKVKEICPATRWTLYEYCRECGGSIDIGCFSTMVVYGTNIVMYDRNKFQRDTLLGA